MNRLKFLAAVALGAVATQVPIALEPALAPAPVYGPYLANMQGEQYALSSNVDTSHYEHMLRMQRLGEEMALREERMVIDTLYGKRKGDDLSPPIDPFWSSDL